MKTNGFVRCDKLREEERKTRQQVEPWRGAVMMEDLPVYHGAIGKGEGERRLARDGRDGCYLVRDSDSVAGVYCLCVL